MNFSNWSLKLNWSNSSNQVGAMAPLDCGLKLKPHPELGGTLSSASLESSSRRDLGKFNPEFARASPPMCPISSSRSSRWLIRDAGDSVPPIEEGSLTGALWAMAVMLLVVVVFIMLFVWFGDGFFGDGFTDVTLMACCPAWRGLG